MAIGGWKRWLIAFFSTVIVLSLGLYAFQITVDPFAVWGTEVRPGFNNNKIFQDKTERIFKIYQYEDAAPRVVFFGSSRVNYCTPAEWPGVPDAEVFNFGINAVHVPEMKFYFDAAMDVRVPRTVTFGVDLLQFSGNFNKPRKGFSADRLTMVGFSRFTSFLYRSRDTVLSFDAIDRSLKTIEASEKYPDATVRYERGWDTRAMRKRRGTANYRRLLWKYHRGTYRKFKWSERNHRLFASVIERCRELGVDWNIYINPVHADFLMCYDTNDLWEEAEEFKRRLVKLGSVWDFNYVNKVTTDRRLFKDPSHFMPEIGRQIISTVASGKISGDFGVRLTRDNIDEQLADQRKHYQEFRERNMDMHRLLERARRVKDQSGFNREAIRLIGR